MWKLNSGSNKPKGRLLTQALGKFLANLGNLRADDHLAIHAAGIVLVELTVFRFRLVERFKGSDLCHHRTGLATFGVQFLDIFRRLVSLGVSGVKNYRSVALSPVSALEVEGGGVMGRPENI